MQYNGLTIQYNVISLLLPLSLSALGHPKELQILTQRNAVCPQIVKCLPLFSARGSTSNIPAAHHVPGASVYQWTIYQVNQWTRVQTYQCPFTRKTSVPVHHLLGKSAYQCTIYKVYQCTIYQINHCTSVPSTIYQEHQKCTVLHHKQHPLTPILCHALMRSSLHGLCVHGHNVVTYHCHGGFDKDIPSYQR